MKKLQIAVIVSALLIGVNISAQQKATLPEKVMGMYTGWYAPNQDDSTEEFVKKYVEKLAKYRFNTFSVKFQGARRQLFNLKDPKQYKRVEDLAMACKKNNITLIAIIYLHTNGKRDPKKHKKYPALVRYTGEKVERSFSLHHWPTWRFMLDEAYQLAEASKKLPIAGVVVDIEHINTGSASYDDESWSDFAAEYHLNKNVPVKKRHQLLESKKLVKEYEKFFARRLEYIAERYEKEIHAINPELPLGVMPVKDYPTSWAFVKKLGTAKAPGIMDSWEMYRGSGFNNKVRNVQKSVKAANPYNKYYVWLRPDCYYPDDITIQCYYAAMNTDGYNNWHIGMLDKGKGRWRVPAKFGPKVYWEAYEKANQLIRADVAAGKFTKAIPFKAPKPQVAKMDLNELAKLPIPQLIPAGDGSGKPQMIPTRQTRTFYIYAEAGNPIKVELWHMAGSRVSTALQYAVVSPDGKIIRNEACAPGSKEKFSVTAPKNGTYALYVNGQQAWYGVKILNKHMAIPADAKHQARLFLNQLRKRKFLKLYFERFNPASTAQLISTTGRGQFVDIYIDGKFKSLVKPVAKCKTDIPAGTTSISELAFGRPDKMPAGAYTQLVWFYLTGAAYPYFFDGPQRRLIPAKK